MKLIKLTVLFLLINLTESIAQSVPAPVPNVIPPSPEAQSFMRYGEIPVDVSTGVPDIKVPLYQITSGKLSLPVSITYHSSGIKVNDVASVVGLGWRLSAGGVLTKSVVGKPDNSSSYGMFSYPYLTKAQIDALPQDGSQFLELKMVSEGTMDGESDKYYYSVGDKLSGEFIYDHSFNIIQAEYTDNKIIGLYPLAYETGPSAYEVISADGTKYYFEACEYSETDMDPHYISSWWLTRIVSADNIDQITFEYQRDNTPIAVFTQSQSLTIDGLASPVAYGGSQTNTNALILKKITFKNGYISFDYLNDRKDLQNNRLSVVSIYSNDSTNPLKKYQFSQSYFNSNEADNKCNYRLRLDHISAFDAASQNVQNYSFEYDHQYDMPPYINPAVYQNSTFAYAQDFYGYYNGVFTNQHLITGFPQIANLTPANVFPANRNSDFNFAKTCILTKINYPTGGSTSFEYESNEGASQYAQFPGAGLRVHRIISKTDQNTIAKIKRYEYANNLLSADLDLDVAGSNHYDWEPRCYLVQGGPTYTTYLASTVLPFANFHGNQVIYQNIDEYDDDPISNVNLKKSYIYGADNDQIISVNYLRYGNQYYVDCPWKKGQLIGVNSYKYTPTAGYILKKAQFNSYSNFRDNIVNAGTKVERIHPPFNPCGFGDQYQLYPVGTTYQQLFNYFDIPIEVGTRKLVSTLTTEFDDNGNSIGATQSNSYSSPYHLLPTEKSSSTSNGDIRKTVFSYPNDFSGTPVYDQMIARNEIDPIIEQKSYKVSNGINTFLESTKTDYGFWNGSSWSSISTDIIVPQITQTQLGTNGYEPRIQYNAYNIQGNIADQSKIGGARVSYKWGYNGQYPVAQVMNAAVNDIFYDGFEEGNGNAYYNDAKTGHQSHNGYYTQTLNGLDNGNYILSYSQKLGNTWSLQIASIQVTGNTYTISLNGQFDDVRFYPVGAQMTTYTYDPLIGMTSTTDSKGNATYYEYDDFQRLRIVKDNDRNIIKAFCYNYAGQVTNCLVPQNDQPQIPPTIYARIEYGTTPSYIYNNYYDGNNEQDFIEIEDVRIVFYSDAACTIPYTLTANISVNVQDDMTSYDYLYGQSTNASLNTYTVPAGYSSYSLGFLSVYDNLDTYDYYWNYIEGISTYYNYSVTPDSGGAYTPVASTPPNL